MNFNGEKEEINFESVAKRFFKDEAREEQLYKFYIEELYEEIRKIKKFNKYVKYGVQLLFALLVLLLMLLFQQ